MSAAEIWVSFILSLITNMIVLSGSISFLFWLDEQTSARVVRLRAWIETILSSLFLVFLWGESWLHTTLEPNGFGLHWTFLNMLIIIMFLLNIHLRIWWQGIIEALMMFAYVVVYADHLNLELAIFYLGFVAMLYISNRWRETLFRHVWPLYLTLGLLALFGIALIDEMGTPETDPYFWLRQISALVILSVTGIEYMRASMKTLQHNQQTALLAKRDGLTQLNNFSQFNHDLETIYERFQTTAKPYAVFELDIDLFKQVNDQFGHPLGNTVLRRVAQEIAFFAASAPYPVCAYRIGGEEFSLIVDADCSQTESAYQVANQLRERLSHLTFDFQGVRFTITISIGQANSQVNQYNSHDIYKAADRSLYLSKRRGRNRVTIDGHTLEL